MGTDAFCHSKYPALDSEKGSDPFYYCIKLNIQATDFRIWCASFPHFIEEIVQFSGALR